MESTIYNQSGKETGSVKLPESVFNTKLNSNMVHEVLISMRSNARVSIAHTKGRSEVRGGGKKPWRQKGTGRARHGSSRSPIWRGGGVTFGPTKEKDYKKKINKKVKAKALFMLLSAKLRDGEILFLDNLNIDEAKTKNAKAILENLSTISGFEELRTKRKNTVYIYTADKDSNVKRSFNNFGNVATSSVNSMNPIDVASYKYLIITNPEKSVTFLENKIKNTTSYKLQATS
jgi:large subunit ribosomal protein L4